ncbi:MAG: glycosyltransferase family 2 protein [Desulfobulbaceae bacterium]
MKEGAPGRPLVSVVTVVLDRVDAIARTIESVLAQTYAPLEYIVIDGGSTDGTRSVIKRYDDRIDLWRSEPDRGVSDAFNKGIGLARGAIIGLINGGDWYEPDAVEQVVSAFTDHPEVGVVCGALQFRRQGRREYVCRSVPELLEREMTVTHPTCFIRRELYEKYGMFSEEYSLAMDYRLLLGLKVKGVRFMALPAVLANMEHAGMSEENWEEALRETHRARQELLPGSLFAHPVYYQFLAAKRRARILLEKSGCENLVRLYRARLALVRKTREDT